MAGLLKLCVENSRQEIKIQKRNAGAGRQAGGWYKIVRQGGKFTGGKGDL
jgi:hypothetical protein